VKDEASGIERERAYLLPSDETIGYLSHDPDLLIEAVRERRRAGRAYHLSPDEISQLTTHHKWHTDCWIAEHIVDFVEDYDDIPESMR
jgi:hypothetical protein